MWNIVARLKRLRGRPDFAPLAILIAAAVLSHRNWFFSLQTIAVGDWPYLWPAWMRMFLGPPISWMSEFDLGYYNSSAPSHWVQATMGLLSAADLEYGIIERLLYFWPVALLPGVSFYFFVRPTHGRAPSLAAGLVYQLNTAVLFYDAAHLNFAMAYGLAPLLFLFTRRAINKSSVRSATASGLALAAILVFEPRFAYILTWAILGYVVFLFLRHPPVVTRKHARTVAVMFGVPLTIHAYWLVPALLFPAQALSVVQTGLLMPYTTLPYSLALYDPFWSGGLLANFTVQPLPWFAFLLPLFAFGALLSNRLRGETVFFAFLAVCGVFLAKQNNPPLADVYPWLFAHFPGFVLFRESSKFFVLTGLGYAFLTGSVAQNVLRLLPGLHLERFWPLASDRRRRLVALLAVGIVTGSSLAPSQAAFAGTLGYAYDTTNVPTLYNDLETLVNSGGFSRVLWFLAYPTFGFRTNEHPAVNAVTFFPRYQDRLPKDSALQRYLDLMSVKYVVQTNETAYSGDPTFDYVRNWYADITTNLSLQRLAGFPDAEVWRNPTALPHVYGLDLDPLRISDSVSVLSAPRILLDVEEIGVDELRIVTPQSGRFVLVLSEGYDPNWIANAEGETISGVPLLGLLNAFGIENGTGRTIAISYRAQTLFTGGAVGSIVVIAVSLAYSIRPFHPWEWLARRRNRRTVARQNGPTAGRSIRTPNQRPTRIKSWWTRGKPDRGVEAATQSRRRIGVSLGRFMFARARPFVPMSRRIIVLGALCLLVITAIATGFGGFGFTDALVQAAYALLVLGVAVAILQLAVSSRRSSGTIRASELGAGPGSETGPPQP